MGEHPVYDALLTKVRADTGIADHYELIGLIANPDFKGHEYVDQAVKDVWYTLSVECRLAVYLTATKAYNATVARYAPPLSPPYHGYSPDGPG